MARTTSALLTWKILPALLIAVFSACNQNEPSSAAANEDSVDIHDPAHALKGLTVADGLEIIPFATEPMLKNPTNMDVDERGRVWITEAYNYRPGINGNPVNAQGDRIVILEDTTGDGRADTAKVFYQSPEINAPLGVCVLGNRVIVSQSPYVWNFYDDNGDDRADRKEILFQGIGGEQHDHGVHSFQFGPDGKLYFTFGNEGRTLKDKNGNTVLDQDGDPIGPDKYREGMVFRCDLDGSNVECLGNNFRNNYEVGVDSYGNIWQSDNDDDGNRGTRINYVMDYGNYGYKDELTGASWQSARTNLEDSIPLQHWHLNDPGVVPNLLQTGAGSPTGMVVYEGTLLPEAFRNQVIHCDPGPNVVRAYPVKKSGAGYTASITNLLDGARDQWFRPADISIAPDGSLFIADWYDPGVGGHQAGDQQRGRVYRVAPDGKKSTAPKENMTTAAGAVAALQNPNNAVRYHAWMQLQKMGAAAVPELEKLWRQGKEPRMQARAFWVLVKMPGGEKYIDEAIRSANPDFRIMGLRAARQLQQDLLPLVRLLVNDNDKQVLRESALALRHQKAAEAADLWAALAKKHTAGDRWYLEALGISADRQWDAFFSGFVAQTGNPLQTPAYEEIVWRARTDKAVPYLAQLAVNEQRNMKERLKYFRAFDFNKGPEASRHLLAMIKDTTDSNIAFNKLVLQHLDLNTVQSSAKARGALKKVLRASEGTPEYVALVRQYKVRSENPALLQLALQHADQPLGRDALGALLQLNGTALVRKEILGKDTARSRKLLELSGRIGSKESLDLLQQLALSKENMDLRTKAAGMIGRSWTGEDRVLELLKAKRIPEPLIQPAVEGMKGAWRRYMYTEALTFVPGGAKNVVVKQAPAMATLMALNGNVEKGKQVFQTNCALCHRVGNQGFNFGPQLTEIGTKLPRESLFDALIHPSNGISFGYETWELQMKDGSRQTGVIGSQTESDIEMKYPGGQVLKIKAADVKSRKQLNQSMMPPAHESLSNEQIADIVAYLGTLKKK